MKVGEAFVEVRADTSKFGPELSQGVEQSGKQAASGLSQALTAGIAVAGFSKIIGAASSLQEAGNKVKETFGASSAEVEAFAETSAESFGISESAALSLAGGIGSMLIPLGTSQEEAASMSTTMLSLAADMGSFNDQDPTEMLERLRSGLAGESEPLRQFGAFISEARVQQFAWSEGIAENGVALTEQQKVMARYGLILQDTAAQQGDFTRTQTSAANAQRTAAATAEDSAASLGENFLPVYEQGLAAVRAFAGAFQALPAPLQTVGVLLAGFAAFKGPLTGLFSAVSAAAQGMVGRIREAGGGIRSFGSALSAGNIIGGIAVVGIGLITAAMAKQAKTAEETRGRVKSLTAAWQEGGLHAAGQTFLTQITEDAPEVLDALHGMEGGVGAFVAAVGEGGPEAEAAIANLGAAIADVPLESWNTFMEGGFVPSEQQARIYDTAHALNLFVDPLTQASGAARELTADQESVTAATEDTAMSAEELADAYDDLTEAVDAYLGRVQGTEEANAAAEEAQLGFFEALVKNGATFRDDTVAGRENIAARNEWVDTVGGQVTAAFDFAAAGGNVDVAQRRANNAVRDGIGELRAMRDAGRITAGQFREYAGVLRNIPHRIDSELRADGRQGRQEIDDNKRYAGRFWDNRRFVAQVDADESGARNAFNNAIRMGEAWDGKYYTADFRANIPPAIRAPTEQAAGGPFNAGEAYLVGERGPELRVENHSGHTFTAAQTRSILANGGAGTPVGGAGGMNVTVVVEGNVIGDVDRFADEIAFRAAEKISRGAI